MRDDRGVAVAPGQVDGVQGLADGADLVNLDQDGICHAAVDALLQAARRW